MIYLFSFETWEERFDNRIVIWVSIVGNAKKIGLKNIGIVDEFAIDALCEQPQLFDDQDCPKIKEIKNYAVALNDADPVKYAIQDIFGE